MELLQKELFWEALGHCFKKSGLTKKGFSDISKVSQSTLSEQFNRVKECREGTQKKIAGALGYNLPDFLELGRNLMAENADYPGNRLPDKLFELYPGIEGYVKSLNTIIETEDPEYIISGFEKIIEFMKKENQNQVFQKKRDLAANG